MGDKPFNGAFDAAWELFNRFWRLGTILVVATIWVLQSNDDHKDQAVIKALVVKQAQLGINTNMKLDSLVTYVHENLTTNDDMDAIIAQAQGVHDDLYRRVHKVEINGEIYVPGRILYRKQYGPMPSKRFQHWFWQGNPTND